MPLEVDPLDARAGSRSSSPRVDVVFLGCGGRLACWGGGDRLDDLGVGHAQMVPESPDGERESDRVMATEIFLNFLPAASCLSSGLGSQLSQKSDVRSVEQRVEE